MSDYSASVKYYTDFLYNSNSDFSSIEAIIDRSFLSPIIEDVSLYNVEIERMELSLNGIPYYDTTDLTETIQIIPNDTFGQILGDIQLNIKAYSLFDVITEINNAFDQWNGSDNVISTENGVSFRIQLHNDGYTRLEAPISLVVHQGSSNVTEEMVNYRIKLPDRLNQILGINYLKDWSTEETPINNTLYRCLAIISDYPRMDTGDELLYIRILTNLPVNSDVLGDHRAYVLTDICPISSINSSLSNSIASTDWGFNGDGLSYSQRQKLVYAPSVRRFINMSTPIPISTIRIWAEYVTANGKTKMVTLPPGCTFSIKLGFFFRDRKK